MSQAVEPIFKKCVLFYLTRNSFEDDHAFGRQRLTNTCAIWTMGTGAHLIEREQVRSLCQVHGDGFASARVTPSQETLHSRKL